MERDELCPLVKPGGDESSFECRPRPGLAVSAEQLSHWDGHIDHGSQEPGFRSNVEQGGRGCVASKA
jgi:hypothetical protein